MARREADARRTRWPWGLGVSLVGALLAAIVPLGAPTATPAESKGATRPASIAPPPAGQTFVRSVQAAQRPRAFDVAVPGDRPLRFAPGLPTQDRTLVYLHGMCGGEEGADVWADAATAYGSLVTLRADVPCADRPGYKWPKDPATIEARIQRALEVVRTRTGDAPSGGEIWLIGYSQGAHRAERLAAAYPHRYRVLALGGPPSAASPERLRHARKVAIFGGELEDTSHMVDGFLALHAVGLETEFFTLPRAGHGTFGPDGPRVLSEIFAYLARSP